MTEPEQNQQNDPQQPVGYTPQSPEPIPQYSQPFDPQQQYVQNQPRNSMRILKRVASILLLIFGLLAGAFLGFMISFSACFKSDCSPVESGAMIWIPLATLLFTVPLVMKTFKK